ERDGFYNQWEQSERRRDGGGDEQNQRDRLRVTSRCLQVFLLIESDGGEIQSAYLSGQGRALFQMCSPKENISVDVIVRNKKTIGTFYGDRQAAGSAN
ncbi:hypothetical protein DY000_02050310, partial [Brassica cretica]